MSILLPSDTVSSSPSQRDGLTRADEVLYRILGCDFISDAGISLTCPQSIINTACILFHRFYYRKSLFKYDVLTVAMGSLLLAAKVEEFPILLRDIILAFYQVYRTRALSSSLQDLEVGGKRYQQWKSALITIERYILKELGFSFYCLLDHPHKFLLIYLKVDLRILLSNYLICLRIWLMIKIFASLLGTF